MQTQTTETVANRPAKRRVITVQAADIPPRWGHYQRHVLAYGHEPGVLSGAELEGKAAKYSGRYAASRGPVVAWAKQRGVTPRYHEDRCGACLWTDTDGNVVEFTIVAKPD